MGASSGVTDESVYVMRLDAVKSSAETQPNSTPNISENSNHVNSNNNDPSPKCKGRLKRSGSPPTVTQTPTAATAPSLVTPSAAETRSLPDHSRKGSSSSFKTNGSAKKGDTLSRSTSTMSSTSIASNISQLCEKFLMQPLIRSRSVPGLPAGNSAGRGIPYLHRRRRRGKCLKVFCMRLLPPAAACSGFVSWQLNYVADRQLGRVNVGTGDKPVHPVGFSKGNPGLSSEGGGEGREMRDLRSNVPTREEVEERPPEQPLYNFFICHTEEDYEPFVKKLVKKCEKEGVSIFSRSYSLLWGDSKRMDTETALASATFGIVLLSPALLRSYRNSWCEKDLDVLFDRTTTLHNNMILPIYAGGITHPQVQERYPFLSTYQTLIYEEEKVDGIVKKMKLLLERRSRTKGGRSAAYSVQVDQNSCGSEVKSVSGIEVSVDSGSPLGTVCTRPSSLTIEKPGCSSTGTVSSSSSVADCPPPDTPSKLNGVLRNSSNPKCNVKKTLRFNPDTKVMRKETGYRSDGVVNHCCHCGPLSGKYRYDEMEAVHQARIAADHAPPSEDEGSDEEEEDEEAFLSDPYQLNALLPYSITSLPYSLLHKLSILLDPLSTAGSDFTSLASKIGFCSPYIKYLKALDIKRNSPLQEVLRMWADSAEDATVGDLVYLLSEIKRYDAISELRDYYEL